MNLLKIKNKDALINMDLVTNVSFTSQSIYFHYSNNHKVELYLPNEHEFKEVRDYIETEMVSVFI